MSSSMWADYFREKGLLVIESCNGFMSAYIQAGVCVVDNFYVKPDKRGTSSALQLTLQLIEQAKQAGCKDFAAEIYKADPMYTYILRLHRHFGMEVVEDTDFKTVTSKRI
jgi:predicted GNAT family acetyltransferase